MRGNRKEEERTAYDTDIKLSGEEKTVLT